MRLSCTGPLASTASGSLSGTYGADSYEEMSGTTLGHLTGADVTLKIMNPLGPCNMTLAGDLGLVNYSNDGFLISSTLDLTATAATGTGCAGLINVGDTITYGATYDVIPVLTISSP